MHCNLAIIISDFVSEISREFTFVYISSLIEVLVTQHLHLQLQIQLQHIPYFNVHAELQSSENIERMKKSDSVEDRRKKAENVANAIKVAQGKY